MRDADFRSARLDSVRFHGCDLTGAWFADARIERTELRGCTLDGIRGIAGLRGAQLEPDAIVGLAWTMADALGIRSLEED